MTGAIAPNLHEGSRSEILADYLFSTWGTVTPVRRQDDHGIDLYCTMIERKGQRAFVTDYYSVQVKSATDPLVFDGVESVQWFIDHPTPFFLASVDKKGGRLRLFHTLPRFAAQFAAPTKLVLKPGEDGEGTFHEWQGTEEFSLSAPILDVALADLMDAEKLKHFGTVLQFWIGVDRSNCDLRRMNVTRFRRPAQYSTNVVPSGGRAEIGLLRKPTDAAILTLVEIVDCVGHQLAKRGDRKAGVLAALLIRHLLTSMDKSVREKDGRWPLAVSGFLGAMNIELNSGVEPAGGWNECLDKIGHRFEQDVDVGRFISTVPTGPLAPMG
ncbi:MAG: hypothetical protein KBA31_00085 [Alphaproteobacteria bacterium]|nr:hypothetical protein [Alphaproteobacteria bacterium]